MADTVSFTFRLLFINENCLKRLGILKILNFVLFVSLKCVNNLRYEVNLCNYDVFNDSTRINLILNFFSMEFKLAFK